MVESLNEKTLIIDSVKFFQEISNYIWVFDDIERVNFSVMELFGYINELVEHKNSKVILVANEMKLLENTAINKEQYSQIKEKIIGGEICYTPNLRAVIEKICCGEKDNAIKKIIKRNKNMLVNTIKKFKCKNLRTLKFCISNLRIILNQIEKSQVIQNNIQACNDFVDRILKYLIHICILYKENYCLFDWKNLLGCTSMITLKANEQSVEILGFRYVDDLIRTSMISIKEVEKMYISYKEKIEYKLYQKGSAYDIVTNFIGRSDCVVIDGIKQMNIEIINNLHVIELYDKILQKLLFFL